VGMCIVAAGKQKYKCPTGFYRNQMKGGSMWRYCTKRGMPSPLRRDAHPGDEPLVSSSPALLRLLISCLFRVRGELCSSCWIPPVNQPCSQNSASFSLAAFSFSLVVPFPRILPVLACSPKADPARPSLPLRSVLRSRSLPLSFSFSL